MCWILPEQSGGSCLPTNRMVEFNVTCFQKVVSGLMMVLKKSFERENNNQPKEEKRKKKDKRKLTAPCWWMEPHSPSTVLILSSLQTAGCEYTPRMLCLSNVLPFGSPASNGCSNTAPLLLPLVMSASLLPTFQSMNFQVHCWDGIFYNFHNVGASYMLPW